MIRSLKTAIVFHAKLCWLNRQREKTLDAIDDAMQQAKTEDERDEIWQTNHWEIEVAQQVIQQHQAQYYFSKARRYGIPKPEGKDDWEPLVGANGDRVLTVKAIAALRSAVRQERKEFREMWLPYAAIIISVVALLFSFLNYRKPSTQQIVVPVQPIVLPTPVPTPPPNQPKPHQSKTNKAGR